MLSEFNEFEIDEEDFTSGEFDISGEFETRYLKPQKSREIPEHYLKYSDAEHLAKNLSLDTPARYYCIVNGSFYFGDFIEALIVEHDIKVKHLLVSTLSMCENNVDSLAGLLNLKYVNKLDLIISDYFYSHERNNLIPYLYKELDKGGRFQLAVAGTHCKLCLMETTAGQYIVIHGSANLRSSSNIEQFCIEDNRELYNFFFDYQKLIIEEFKTIDKSVRGKKLWETIGGDDKVNTGKKRKNKKVK